MIKKKMHNEQSFAILMTMIAPVVFNSFILKIFILFFIQFNQFCIINIIHFIERYIYIYIFCFIISYQLKQLVQSILFREFFLENYITLYDIQNI